MADHAFHSISSPEQKIFGRVFGDQTAPGYFQAQPTDHNPEASLQQPPSQPCAVLDLLFAEMATDMDDLGDLSD